jgi:hypothetical protein
VGGVVVPQTALGADAPAGGVACRRCPALRGGPGARAGERRHKARILPLLAAIPIGF